MSYSTTLNINDMNDIFFPHTIDNKPVNTKSNEFNFAQVWEDIDSEYNEVSEFVEACKLIISNNAIAAAIALNEQSVCSNNTIEQNSLAAFVGDIMPAAVAVAGCGESPTMSTPFLDTCVGTPFTPASVFTPSLAQFQNSPYYSPYNYNIGMANIDCQQDDIQVASYLQADLSSWQTPSHVTADLFANTPTISATNISPELLNSLDNFNDNTTQVLLNSSVPQHISPSTIDDTIDPLFPPLPSDEPTHMNNLILNQQNDVFTTEDFEASNFLEDCFDDCLFNMQEETTNSNKITHTTYIEPKPMTTVKILPDNIKITTNNNKRKNKEIIPDKKNKRFKASIIEENKDRKFECDICHATFNRRYNLGTHVKVHSPTRIKDFGCHLCTKAFDRKHDLTRHIATVHNGERAYSCNLCTSTFSRKDALVRHGIQKHQVQP